MNAHSNLVSLSIFLLTALLGEKIDLNSKVATVARCIFTALCFQKQHMGFGTHFEEVFLQISKHVFFHAERLLTCLHVDRLYAAEQQLKTNKKGNSKSNQVALSSVKSSNLDSLL